MQKHAPGGWPFADVGLARRLEGAEGRANVESVSARARLSPERGAAWIEVAGTWAMFDGVDSPLTQTFGLGLFGDVGPDELAAIEGFFTERGAPVYHEVSPVADPDIVPLLNGRGYKAFEFSSVLFRPIDAPLLADMAELAHSGSRVKVTLVGREDHETWTRTAADGWSEYPELAGFMEELAAVTVEREGAYPFLARLEGQPVATGLLSVHEGVALLAGASTIPSARRQGAQSALLAARLRFAAEASCDLAMMAAAPGSASQRNSERNGFRIAYTRLKWRLAP
jgi:hypothetical protein